MKIILETTSDGCVHTFREVLDVAPVQSSHRDTTISSHVDMRLLSQGFSLGGV